MFPIRRTEPYLTTSLFQSTTNSIASGTEYWSFDRLRACRVGVLTADFFLHSRCKLLISKLNSFPKTIIILNKPSLFNIIYFNPFYSFPIASFTINGVSTDSPLPALFCSVIIAFQPVVTFSQGYRGWWQQKWRFNDWITACYWLTKSLSVPANLGSIRKEGNRSWWSTRSLKNPKGTSKIE